MEKDKILEKAKKKHPIGEMERQKVNTANWISLVISCVYALALIIVEGAKKHFDALYAIASICYLWATIFYICQRVVAKRNKGVLIGAVLHGIAFVVTFTFYILYSMGVL